MIENGLSFVLEMRTGRLGSNQGSAPLVSKVETG